MESVFVFVIIWNSSESVYKRIKNKNKNKVIVVKRRDGDVFLLIEYWVVKYRVLGLIF